MAKGDPQGSVMESTLSKLRRKAFASKSVKQIEARTEVSEHLARTLSSADLVFLGVGSIVGAGVFVVTGVAARDYAGPGVIISYLLAGASAIFSAFCYAEFAVEMPVAGGAFTYVNQVFGEFTAWIAATNFLLEYTLSAAAVARASGSYTATLFGAEPDVMRIDLGGNDDVNWSLDFYALANVIILCGLLALGTQGSARFNNAVTLLSIVVIVFIIIAGLSSSRFDTANLTPFIPFGAKGIFKGASQVYFAFIGFDTVATASEETRRPERSMPLGIVGSLFICMAIYVLMCLTICGLVVYTDIDGDAPFSVAFKDLGMDWAVYVISLGAVAAIVTSLLAVLLGNTRLLMSIARENLISPWLAKVNSRTKTPINATLTSCVTVGVIALFVDLDFLIDLVSMGTLFVFLMVSLACLWKRYHTPGTPILTTTEGILKWLKVSAVVAFSIGLSFNYSKDGPHWLSYTFLGLLAASIVLLYTAKVVYKPEKFRLPGGHIIPCLAVFTNIFLFSTLGDNAYYGWLILFGVSAIWYIIYGVQRSPEIEEDVESGAPDIEISGRNPNEMDKPTVEKGDAALPSELAAPPVVVQA